MDARGGRPATPSFAGNGDNRRLSTARSAVTALAHSPVSAAPNAKVSTPPNPVASRLSYAALLPFVLGASLVWLVRPDAHPYVVDALAKYAALAVCFLAGTHWGLAMRQPVPSPAPFAWSALATLVSWVAVIMPAYAGLIVQGLALIASYLIDRKSYPSLGASAWLTLRFRFTAMASLSCFLAAAGS